MRKRAGSWWLFVLVIGCPGAEAPSDVGVDAPRDVPLVDASALDAPADVGADIDGGSDTGTDAGSDVPSDAGVVCPCFSDEDLDFIESLGGDRTCVVDQMGGGTTQTALVQVFTEERVAAETPIGSDGTRYCGWGCLPNELGGACGRGPTFERMTGISEAEFDVCHDLIAARCE